MSCAGYMHRMRCDCRSNDGVANQCDVRHHCAVSLRALSLWLQFRLRRPGGLMTAFALFAVMVLAGMPSGEVHAHQGGDQQHEHQLSLHAEHDADHDDAHNADPKADAAAGDGTLHTHDACATASTLPPVISLAVKAVLPASPAASATISPPSAKQQPDDRPPIA